MALVARGGVRNERRDLEEAIVEMFVARRCDLLGLFNHLMSRSVGCCIDLRREQRFVDKAGDVGRLNSR